MFAINDIVVLIDFDYDSYVKSEGFIETGVIVKVLNTQGNAIRVESTGSGFWLREQAFRLAMRSEKEAYSIGVRNIRDIKSIDLTGRYIKALISAPYGGMVDKGEYGKITDHSGLNGCYVDFPSHRRYYWTDLKEASKGEVMPVGFDPKTSNSVDPTEDLSYYTNRYFKVLKGVFNSISCIKGDYLYQYDRDRCKIMRNSSLYYLSKPWIYIKSGDIELMPLGFDPMSDQVSARPASLYPDYARCIKACSTGYTVDRIYPVDTDGYVRNNDGKYDLTRWDRKGKGNSDFESSDKESFEHQEAIPKKKQSNPFKIGDEVMVDRSKFSSSFYSSVTTFSRNLVENRCYMVNSSSAEFLRVNDDSYDHPWDIFYLAPKRSTNIVEPPKVTTTEARRRYPVGTSFISPENGKTYKVRSHTYGDNGFYEAGKDILCHNETTSGGQFVYLSGKWADIVSVSTDFSDELTSLPSKWCIQRTDEAANIVNKWFTDNGYGSPYMTDYNYICRLGDSYEAHSNPKAGYTVITLQQFKDWVMTKPTKKEDKADATKQSVRPSDDLEFQKPILVKRVKSKSKLVIIN